MRVVSKKLRDSARGQSCTLRLAGCTFDSDQTVLAHLPCGQKGMGMKGPDMIAVFACMACHDLLDSHHRLDIPAGDLLRALAETQLIWIASGLLTVKGPHEPHKPNDLMQPNPQAQNAGDATASRRAERLRSQPHSRDRAAD